MQHRFRLILTTVLLMLLLIGSFGTRAHAFTNGQSASLVIGHKDFTSDATGISPSEMSYPIQVIFDSFGNMWVVQHANGRVVEFKPPFSTGMDASLVIGQPDFASVTYKTTQSGLNTPMYSAFDSSGDLWIPDQHNNRVLEFKPPFSSGMPASLVIGQKDFTHAFPALGSNNGLNFPDAVAFDPSGNMWVADQANNRVLEYMPPFSTGMNASAVIGQSNLHEYQPATTQSGMWAHEDVNFDPLGNLWVGEEGPNRVLQYRPPFSTGMDASLVIGQPDFVTNKPSNGKTGLIPSPTGLMQASALTPVETSGSPMAATTGYWNLSLRSVRGWALRWSWDSRTSQVAQLQQHRVE